MKKLRFVFCNVLYMLGMVWNFDKLLFWGRLFIAILTGCMKPINAFTFKILIEKVSVFNWFSSLLTIGIIGILNLSSELIKAYVNKKIGISNDLFRNFLMFELNSKIVNMDYEILFEPKMMQKKDMALKAIQEGRATKYIDIVFTYISHFITLISIMYLLLDFSWLVYFVLLLLCVIKIFTVVIDKKRSYDTSIEMAPINTEITYYMSMLTDEAYVNDMRMLSISRWVIQKYKSCIERTHKLIEKLLSSLYINTIIRSFASTAEIVFSYVFAAVQMIFNSVSFADFTLLTNVLQTFSSSVSKITNCLIDMGENSAYVEIVRQFMSTENKIAVEGKGENVNRLINGKYAFELINVGFKYPGVSKEAVSNVNLRLESGKFYVIVGENGAGKTTLVRLLCRLYDVSSGEIKYKGNDIKNLEYKSYRENIGVVFQDYKYYCLSIAENVAMNEYDGTDETNRKIIKALTKAGLGNVISSLPKGIHTPLGKIFDKEGVLLSGGELQKLALARVLFKNPSIVILDEPSSALDAYAENELISTFNSVLQGKTVIYISHRLSVANYADKVIYMSKGTVKGFDTHQNLLKTAESYKEMYEAQARHYR